MVGRDTSIYVSYSGTFSLFSLSGFCGFFCLLSPGPLAKDLFCHRSTVSCRCIPEEL